MPIPLRTAALVFGFALAACAPTATAPGPAPVADAGWLSWSPPGLWLTAPAGGTATAAVTVADTGAQAATVSRIAVENATRPVFAATPGSLSLAAGGTATVTVSYAPPDCPADGGDDRADLQFTTDARDATSFSMALVGHCGEAVAGDGGTDAGAADAGSDAGTVDDAGTDAGAGDAGVDAGAVTDGGADAGTDDAGADAGTESDAGPDAGAVTDGGADAG